MGITGVIVGLIVLGIVLVLAGANRENMLVDFVLDVASWLTTPFDNLFKRSDYKQEVLINWGLGALAYLFVGTVIARLARG